MLKKGFTLVEVILSIAITVILMGVAIPAVSGYMVSSEMMEANQSARTIFLIAQDYLTQQATAGGLDEINAASGSTPLGSTVPTPGAQEMNDNVNNIRFLRVSKNGPDDTAMTTMLTPYVGNTASGVGPMLQQSILVEYNAQTGAVRSVFYSRRADQLNYDGATTDETDVKDRNANALRDKRQGYYGVDYTGFLSLGKEMKAPEVKFINEDRLTVEWNDITPTGGDPIEVQARQLLTYTLTVYSADWSQEYLRVEGIPNSLMTGSPLSPTIAASETKQLGLATFWNGSGTAVTGDGAMHAVSAAAGKITVILDDIHSPIYDKYPTIRLGDINATVEPVFNLARPMIGQTKEAAHAYFADEEILLLSSTYQVEFARHFNNMRYAAPESNFTQTAELDWDKPELVFNTSQPKVPFETINFKYRTYDSAGAATEKRDDGGYKGNYNGQNFYVKNLVVNAATAGNVPAGYNFTENFGMFSQLDHAQILNTKLSDVVLNLAVSGKPISRVGAFAGTAKDAKLENCRVEGEKSVVASTGSGAQGAFAGGLVGHATNTEFTRVLSEARVVSGTLGAVSGGKIKVTDGRANVGGLVGFMEKGFVNGGTVNAGAAVDGIYGGDNVGGLVGYSKDAKLTDVTKTGNMKTAGGNNVGGLVGLMENGSLTNAQIQAGANAKGVYGLDNTGGIVGRNKGAELKGLKRTGDMYTVGNENVGGIVGLHESGKVIDVAATETKFDETKELTMLFDELKSPAAFEANALVFKEDFKGVLGNKNVGGVIGQNAKGAQLSRFATSQKVKGVLNVGGIVGNNDGDIAWNSDNSKADGLVICAGENAGGVLGVNTNKNLSLKDLTNEAHVVAKEYAGGIIGSNGTKGNTTEKGATMQRCKNKGIVYAYVGYAGGIAGSNTGTIENSSSVVDNADALDKILADRSIPYGDYVGGITGYNDGAIQECTNGNLVRGKNYVGGITGHNDTNGNIYACETTGGRIIATENFAGGFIGLNTSNQLASDTENGDGKAMGGLVNKATLVQGKRFVGGIIGCNSFSKGNLVIQAENGTDKKDEKQPQIIGEAYVGGIIGYNCISLDENNLPDPNKELPTINDVPKSKTKLTLSNNYGSVKGTKYVGGVIGLNNVDSSLMVDRCANSGEISYAKSNDIPEAQGASYYIAGITGRNTRTGVIFDCKNNGKVTNKSKYTGGLVEVNEGLMDKCSNAGAVSSPNSYVGGIAGYNRTVGEVVDGNDKKATIKNCTANGGTVSGASFVGGIVGENTAVLNYCTLTGSTQYTNASFNVSGTGDCVGGITGHNQTGGELTNCSTQGGSIKGRNFVGGIAGYSASTKGINGNPANPGDKTEEFITTNGSRVMGDYFVGGIVGYHTGSSMQYCSNGQFGRVIGKGASATGSITLTLDGKTTTYQKADVGVGGIIGTNADGVTLSNCTNKGVVVGAGLQTGGITGLNKGTIESCRNSGEVIGSSQADLLGFVDGLGVISSNGDNVGGIAGRNDASTGVILNCSAEPSTDKNRKTSVSGDRNVGGLVGIHEKSNAAVSAGKITNPSSTSKDCAVSGFGYVGGLVGNWKNGTIEIAQEYKVVAATVKGSNVGRKTADGTAGSPAAIGGVFGVTNEAVLSGYTFEGVVAYADLANYQYAGGIVGQNQAGQRLESCTNKGSVSGSGVGGAAVGFMAGAGGVAGFNAGVVDGCALEAGAAVSGGYNIGGLIGYNAATGTLLNSVNGKMVNGRAVGGTVTGSYTRAGGYIGYDRSKDALLRSGNTDGAAGKLVNYATVTGYDSVGGIAGESNGSVSNCTNAGEVVLKGSYGGGIVGEAKFQENPTKDDSITITNCYNEGKVSSDNRVSTACSLGGIVGRAITNPKAAQSDRASRLTIENCENRGLVTTKNESSHAGDIGGIAGTLERLAEAKNCANTATGTVSFTVANGNGIGGIAGFINGGKVTGSQNEGTVAFLKKADSAARMGGIAGRSVNGFLTDCTNEQPLKGGAKAYQNIGGIVGYCTRDSAAATGTQITNCKNNGELAFTLSQGVGGIAGNISGVTILGSANTAAITAAKQAGGIAGTNYRSAYAQNEISTIQSSSNSGEIKTTGGAAGGIFGGSTAWELVLDIKDCTNTADVSIAGGEGAGGIIGTIIWNGSATVKSSSVTGCANSGVISVADGKRATGLGGILGDGRLPINITNCTNSAAIGDNGNAIASTVGGIAGSLDSTESTIKNSTNSGTISAAHGSGQNDSVNVGGIAGINNGKIILCKNEATAAAGTITGRNSVGGIVGSNTGEVVSCTVNAAGTVTGKAEVGGIAGKSSGKTALIYTDLKAAAPVQACNMANVNGETKVGGIVGSNTGGGVVSVYNAGAVKGASNVGGLIGEAAAQGGTVGSIANSYNLGTVTGTGVNVGGIIGQRAAAYDSVTSHNIKAAFYVDAGNPAISVGNEPNQDLTVDVNDEPAKATTALDNRKLTDAIFKANGIAVPDYSDIDDVIKMVKLLMNKMEYRLPQPNDVDTVSAKGYEYTTGWSTVQGMVTGYSVFLRPKGIAGDEDDSKDIPLGTTTEIDQNGRLKTTLAFNLEDIFRTQQAKFEGITSFEDLIGKKYDIVVVTMGMPQGNGKALDSMKKLSEQDRKFLPVLPTPGVPAPMTAAVLVNKEYEITIPNPAYDAAINKPAYPNLGTGPDGLYDKAYKQGLAAFRAKNLMQKPDAGFRPTDIQPNAAPYKFQLNHDKDGAGNATTRTIQVQAMSNDIEDGYAHSELGSISYKVQVRLEPPPAASLKAMFQGSSATAAYDLSWGNVANNRGYRVEITYVDALGAAQVESVVLPKNQLQYKWNVPVGNIGDQNAHFTVTTLGDDATMPIADATYLTSVPSAKKDVKLPFQLEKPTLSGAQNADDDTKYALSWATGDAPADIANYVLKISRYPIGLPEQEAPYAFTVDNKATESLPSTAAKRDIKFKEDDFGFTYVFNLQAIGVSGVSLTSPAAQSEFTLYSRRAKPSMVAIAKNSANKLSYHFKWDQLTAAGLPYPAAELAQEQFELIFIGDQNPTFVPVTVSYHDLAAGIDYVFSEANGFVPGDSYYVRLVALAVTDKYARSEQSEPVSFRLPAPLPAPAKIKAKAGADTPVVDYDKVDKLKNTVEWDGYNDETRALMQSPGSYRVRAFVVDEGGVEADITAELTYDNGRPADAADPIGKMLATDKSFFFTAPAKYAGKEVTVEVTAVANTSAADSPKAVVKLTLPKAILSAPAVEKAEQLAANEVKVSFIDDDALKSIATYQDKIAEFVVTVSLQYKETLPSGTEVEKVLNIPMEVENFVLPAVVFTEQQLLDAANAQITPPGTVLDSLPPPLASLPPYHTVTAAVSLKAFKTAETGFKNSDGTDSDIEITTTRAVNLLADENELLPQADSEAYFGESSSSSESNSSSESSGLSEAKPPDNVEAEP